MKRLLSVVAVAICACTGSIGDTTCDGEQCATVIVNDAGPRDCTANPLGPRQLRRLTNEEYDATVFDLVNVASTYGAGFAADPVIHNFDNNAAALRVSPLLAEQLRKAAEEIAAAMSVPACGGAGRVCARDLVTTLGRRAFRRPLAEDEIQDYLAVFDSGAGAGYRVGAELMVATLLQSPFFLYRTELGVRDDSGAYVLTQHELASELSYTFAGSLPDEQLLALADAGALDTPDALEAQARRLLDTPRGRATMVRFVQQWLQLDRLPYVPKDNATYPELTPELRQSMLEESRRFIEDVLFTKSGTFADLLTSTTTFLDERLATLHGATVGEVVLSPRRGGVLMLTGTLTKHALANGSSPIHRGILVRTQLLCTQLPPPPPGVAANPPSISPGVSTRERYAQHATDAKCRSCHQLIDPIGFAFEGYDGIGRARTTDNGVPVSTQSEVTAFEGGTVAVTDAMDVAQALAASSEAHRCFATQWAVFASGVDRGASECIAADLTQNVAALSLQDLMVSTVRSSTFVRRSGNGGSAPSPTEPGTPQPTEPDDPPLPPTGVVATVTTNSQWATGGCHDVVVTNNTASSVAWMVELAVPGTINNAWNSTRSGDIGAVTFSGAEWNATLAPGGTASFGYCFVL